MIRSMIRSTLENKVNYRSLLAGNGAFIPSDYELLETTVLTSSASSVSFTGLGSYTDYKHLQIRAVVRGTSSSSIRSELEFNGTASDYSSHVLQGNGSSVTSGASTSETFLRLGRVISTTSTANSYTAQVIDILDPFSSSKNTTVRSFGGSTGYNLIYLHSGFWNNTASITSIELSPESGVGNWEQYSRFSLYGIKAA